MTTPPAIPPPAAAAAKPRATAWTSEPLRITLVALLTVSVVFGVQSTGYFSSPRHVTAAAPLPPAPQQQAFSHLPLEEQSLIAKKGLVKYDDVWMSSSEIDLLLRYVHDVKSYLEWGSGGSTHNFPQFATERAVSIEHNLPWCEKVTKELDTLKKLDVAGKRKPYVELRCIEVKQGYRGWGKKGPYEEGSYPPFKAYVDEIANLGEERWDFILIDGRSRVDCAIKALSYLNKNSIVVLHDASRVPSIYNGVTKYYDSLESAMGSDRQGITILRRRSEYSNLEGDHAAVQAILDEKYKDVLASYAKEEATEAK